MICTIEHGYGSRHPYVPTEESKLRRENIALRNDLAEAKRQIDMLIERGSGVVWRYELKLGRRIGIDAPLHA